MTVTLWLVALVALSFVAAVCAMHADNRAQKARREVAQMADSVAEVITAIQAKDEARLTRARVALDSIVAAQIADSGPNDPDQST